MKKVIVLLMSLFLLTGCLEEEKLDKIAYTTYYPLGFATNYMYKDFATVKSIYPNGIDTSKYTLTDKQKSILELYYNENLSLSEISDIENVSKSAFLSRKCLFTRITAPEMLF